MNHKKKTIRIVLCAASLLSIFYAHFGFKNHFLVINFTNKNESVIRKITSDASWSHSRTKAVVWDATPQKTQCTYTGSANGIQKIIRSSVRYSLIVEITPDKPHCLTPPRSVVDKILRLHLSTPPNMADNSQVFLWPAAKEFTERSLGPETGDLKWTAMFSPKFRYLHSSFAILITCIALWALIPSSNFTKTVPKDE